MNVTHLFMAPIAFSQAESLKMRIAAAKGSKLNKGHRPPLAFNAAPSKNVAMMQLIVVVLLAWSNHAYLI